MNKNVIIAIIVIIAGGGLLFFFTNSQNNQGESISNGSLDKAPDFTLRDYTGNEVSLSDFRGKVVVANSWAVWCPFCRDELSDFAKLQNEFADSVVVIAIDRAESLEKAKGFTDSIGVTSDFIFLLDPDDSFYTSIGGFSMPETLFVDKEGNIGIHKRGPMRFEEMREKVESILQS